MFCRLVSSLFSGWVVLSLPDSSALSLAQEEPRWGELKVGMKRPGPSCVPQSTLPLTHTQSPQTMATRLHNETAGTLDSGEQEKTLVSTFQKSPWRLESWGFRKPFPDLWPFHRVGFITLYLQEEQPASKEELDLPRSQNAKGRYLHSLLQPIDLCL